MKNHRGFLLYKNFKINLLIDINISVNGIDKTSPYSVRSAEVDTSVNTWQNVFMTDAKMIDAPTEKIHLGILPKSFLV